MVSSVMTLSAISCDRFLAVICPLRTRVTQRKARYETLRSGCSELGTRHTFAALLSDIITEIKIPSLYIKSHIHVLTPTKTKKRSVLLLKEFLDF